MKYHELKNLIMSINHRCSCHIGPMEKDLNKIIEHETFSDIRSILRRKLSIYCPEWYIPNELLLKREIEPILVYEIFSPRGGHFNDIHRVI